MTFLLLWHRCKRGGSCPGNNARETRKFHRDAHTSSRVLQTRSWRASEKSPRHFRTCVRLAIVDGQITSRETWQKVPRLFYFSQCGCYNGRVLQQVRSSFFHAFSKLRKRERDQSSISSFGERERERWVFVKILLNVYIHWINVWIDLPPRWKNEYILYSYSNGSLVARSINKIMQLS